MVQVFTSEITKLLLVVLGLVYVGSVLSGYSLEGSHGQLRFDPAAPVHSSQRLLVWTGIKILGAVIRFVRSMLNELFAASAEVGSWVVDQFGPKVQREVRSRFL